VIGYPENASLALVTHIPNWTLPSPGISNQLADLDVMIGYQQMPHVVTISQNLLTSKENLVI